MDVMNLNDFNGYTVKSFTTLWTYIQSTDLMDLYSRGREGGSISKYLFCIELLFLYQCASTSIVVLIVKNAKSHGFALQIYFTLISLRMTI